METILVTLAVGGALAYLARRAWRHFAGSGNGCCGSCPVATGKIRLAGRGGRGSIRA